jgi:hypothetical protein
MTDDPRATAFEQATCMPICGKRTHSGFLCTLEPDHSDVCLPLIDDSGSTIEIAEDGRVLLHNGPVDAIRTVRASLKAAAPAEGPTWQPIETVRPTSGESLLFFSADGDGPFVGWKNDAGSVFAIQEPCSVRRDATHWMPLPTPPRDPAGKE